jgi:hypothetical protein
MMNPNLVDILLDRLWSWVSGRNITLVRGVVDTTKAEAVVEEEEVGEVVEVGVDEVAEVEEEEAEVEVNKCGVIKSRTSEIEE